VAGGVSAEPSRVSRTPQFRALGRLIRSVAATERAPRAETMDRRAFVAGTGATVAALALGRPMSTGAATPARIAIVGAGISGLSAALALHDRGVAATVYESSARVGGRMHSLSGYWNDDQTSEWCGELTDTTHTTMHALTRRFGLHNVDVLAAMPADAEQTQYFEGKYYFWDDAARDFRPVYAELRRQMRTIGDTTTWTNATPHARELDNVSAYEWIARYVPGGHRSPLGQFLDYSYLAEYGIDTRKQSSLNLIYYIGAQPEYDPRTGKGFSILGASDQRYHIAGGNQQLPTLMAGVLPDGGLCLRHRLTGIAREPDGRVTLTFDMPGGTLRETVDKAIITVPFSVLRTIDLHRAGFDARKMRAIRTLGYGEHSKFVLQFDERWWNRRGPWGVSTGDITTDLDIVNAWEQSRGQRGKSGLVVQFAAGGASSALKPPAPYTMSYGSVQIGDYANHLVKQLDRVWPGIASHYTGKAALSHPSLDPNFRGSYSCWLVGQTTDFAGYEGVRQGNVLFAGEHCNVVYQGFMEGAAREGQRAAREVLHDLGVRAA
jgi:monoamine oxidase